MKRMGSIKAGATALGLLAAQAHAADVPPAKPATAVAPATAERPGSYGISALRFRTTNFRFSSDHPAAASPPSCE